MDKRTWTPNELRSAVKRIADLYDQGKITGMVHLPGGNEDELIEIFKQIKPEDYVLGTHRNLYHALLHGVPFEEMEDRILNGKSGYVFDRERNLFCSAIIGGTVAIAAGLALALKKKGSKAKVWCFIGDGTEDNGHLSEAARYVDGHDLPCKYIIEDNGMACDAPKVSRWGTEKCVEWFPCVKRYTYDRTYPHIRTAGPFPPISELLKHKLDPEICFPRANTEVQVPILASKKKYKDQIDESMSLLGASDNAIFLGYSINPGDAAGSLKDVEQSKKIETPVAENLMVGLAIGLSMEGFKPVVYFERHDFMLVAADAINHADKIEWMSGGEYNCPVIFKTVVDDGDLLYSGPVHSQDFTTVFRELVEFPVLDATTSSEIRSFYDFANNAQGPVMVVERKKFYFS